MLGNKYQTVIDLVMVARDRATQFLLTAKDAEEQMIILGDLFKIAIAIFDDEAAKKFAEWIFHAIDDIHLGPFLKEQAGEKYLLHTDAVEKAGKLIFRARAQKAMELLGKCQTRAVTREYCDYRTRDVESPALLATRRFLFSQIAEWWRKTEDEKEADQLFAFLVVQEPIPGGSGKREESTQELFRKATGANFFAGRLERHISALASGGIQSNDPSTIRTLTIAWARNIALDSLRMKFSLIMALAGCAPDAFVLAEKLLKGIPELDRAAQTIREIFPKGWSIHKRLPPDYKEMVIDEISIFLLPSSAIELLLIVYDSLDIHNPVSSNEKWDGWFYTAKRNIQLWQHDHPYPVIIRLEVWSGDVRLFYREEPIETTEATIAAIK